MEMYKVNTLILTTAWPINWSMFIGPIGYNDDTSFI